MMKKLLAVVVYIVLAGACLTGLHQAAALAACSGEAAVLVAWMPLFPYLLVVAALMVGLHFNRSGVLLLSLFLAATYYCLRSGLLSDEDFLIVISFQSVFFFSAVVTSERGILSVFGALRMLFFASLFLLMLLAARLETVTRYAQENGLDELVQHLETASVVLHGRILPGGWPALYASVCIAVTTVSLSFAVRREDGPVAVHVAALCLFLSVALFFTLLYREGREAELMYAVTFSAQMLILIAFLYFSAWNKVFTDPLTGLPNRRAFDDAVAKLGKTYTITMLDIDRFKALNDQYGHQAGDEVLRRIGKLFQRFGKGRVFRYGGEEFAIVQPRKTHNKVCGSVESLLKKVASERITLQHTKTKRQRGKTVKVTVSAGIAASTQFRTSVAEVIEAADKALYRAKKAGRNRVAVERRKKKR